MQNSTPASSCRSGKDAEVGPLEEQSSTERPTGDGKTDVSWEPGSTAAGEGRGTGGLSEAAGGQPRRCSAGEGANGGAGVKADLEEGADPERDQGPQKEEPKKPSTLSFIHKLYSMIEDPATDSFIWWHANGSNFLVRPNEAFIRNLSNYFKHANIASFIRQLNMYGFHKVDSTYHQSEIEENGKAGEEHKTRDGAPMAEKTAEGDDASGEGTEAPGNEHIGVEAHVKDEKEADSLSTGKEGKLPNHQRSKPKSKVTRIGCQIWEFKHSSGIFKRNNVADLNKIKRRSFRNSMNDREGSMKFTYDIPPNLPNGTETYTGNHIHPIPSQPLVSVVHSDFPQAQQPVVNPMTVQNIPQQIPISHLQPQHQPPMNTGGQDMNDDHSNMVTQAKLDLLEQDRQNIFIQLKDLQHSNSNILSRCNELAHKTDELFKINEIYKDEILNINQDFVSALNVIKDKYLQLSSNTQHADISVDIENIISKIVQRNAYCDSQVRNIMYHHSMTYSMDQYGNPAYLQNSDNSQNISFNRSTDQLPPQQNSGYGTPSNRLSVTPSHSSNAQSLSTPQSQSHSQERHGSTVSQNMHTVNQQQFTASTAQRNLSNASVTSNPYFNSGYSNGSTFAHVQDYMYKQQQPYSPQYIQPNNQAPILQPPPTAKPNHVVSYTKSSSVSALAQPRSQLNTSATGSFSGSSTSNPPQQQSYGTTAVLTQQTNLNICEESPFLHKDIRYNVSLSSRRSRNPSIYDPLQPNPLQQPQAVPVAPQVAAVPTNQPSNGVLPAGVVSFYHVNPIVNGYSNPDPNAITRQYSASHMYSPVTNTGSPTGPNSKNDHDITASPRSSNNNSNPRKYSTPNNSRNYVNNNIISPTYKNENAIPHKNVTGYSSLNGSRHGSRHGSANNLGWNMTDLRSSSVSNLKSPDGRSRNSSFTISHSTATSNLADNYKSKKASKEVYSNKNAGNLTTNNTAKHSEKGASDERGGTGSKVLSNEERKRNTETTHEIDPAQRKKIKN